MATALLLCAAGCAQPLEEDVLVEYQCPSDVRFEVVPVPLREVVILTRGDQSWELARVPAASGTKYSDGRNVFWSKGDSARIELADGERYADCWVSAGP